MVEECDIRDDDDPAAVYVPLKTIPPPALTDADGTTATQVSIPRLLHLETLLLDSIDPQSLTENFSDLQRRQIFDLFGSPNENGFIAELRRIPKQTLRKMAKNFKGSKIKVRLSGNVVFRLVGDLIYDSEDKPTGKLQLKKNDSDAECTVSLYDVFVLNGIQRAA